MNQEDYVIMPKEESKDRRFSEISYAAHPLTKHAQNTRWAGAGLFV